MRRLLGLGPFVGGISMAALIALVGRAVIDLPFWVCFLAAVAAVLANGWLAGWEDEQPGGFNNPLDRPPGA